MVSIGIIGVGNVGKSIAFNLLSHPDVDKILINDIDVDRLEGEIEDLTQAAAIMEQKTEVIMSLKEDMLDCDINFVCIGKRRSCSEESTDDLFYDNIADVSRAIKDLRKESVWIVTNPTERLAENLGTHYLGKLMDGIRKLTKAHNGGWIIDRKGHTNWGIAAEAYMLVSWYVKQHAD